MKVTGLTHTERSVLLCLADHQNAKTGLCRVRSKLIAKECGIHPATVFRVLTRLKKLGLVSIHHRRTQDWQLASDYVLHTDAIPPSHSATPLSHSAIPPSHSATPLNLDLNLGSESGSIIESATASLVAIDHPPKDQIPGQEKIDKDPKIYSAPLQTQSETDMKSEDLLAEINKNLTLEQALTRCSKTAYGGFHSGVLANLWRDLHAVFNLGFVPEMTMKQKGQLATLGKKLKWHTPEVMVAALRNWSGFGQYCKTQGVTGADYPDHPQIGFFLQHADMAVKYQQKPTSETVSNGPKAYSKN
jgi:DNA-binding CsgD family transcriptional regulator